jgi:hypothetical protein
MTPAEREKLGALMGDVDARVEAQLEHQEKYRWREVGVDDYPEVGAHVDVRNIVGGKPRYTALRVKDWNRDFESCSTHWRYIHPPEGCAE